MEEPALGLVNAFLEKSKALDTDALCFCSAVLAVMLGYGWKQLFLRYVSCWEEIMSWKHLCCEATWEKKSTIEHKNVLSRKYMPWLQIQFSFVMPSISTFYLEYGVTAVFIHKVKGKKKRLEFKVVWVGFFPDADWNQYLFHYIHQNMYSWIWKNLHLYFEARTT